MKQVCIKLPEEDIIFLKWYSEKKSRSIASLYREATSEAFKQWKVNLLLKEYQQGAISFNKFCDLANITLLEGMLILEKEEIEPPIPELVDDYTIALTEKNIQEKINK